MRNFAERTRSPLKALGILNSLRMNDENRIRLYEAARSFIGTDASPNDLAPDELGCAETVNEIIRRAFGDYLHNDNRLSTYWLYKALRESPDFTETFIPVPGLIVISPTSFGTRRNPDSTFAIPHGHVGIVMLDGKIASKNSRTGKFEENCTIDSWADRYVKRGGYFMKFHRHAEIITRQPSHL